jgi:N-terminal acetyltransferase B complex non-catalytic subunit
LVNRYLSTQHLVKEMEKTDLRPSDNYIVLASHMLWDLWVDASDPQYFMKATSLLELGLTNSPANWQLKLMLIRLYGVAGCGAASHHVHSSLDVKHLMLDSLGWILPRQLWASGQFNLCRQQYSATVKLYNHVNKDTADHIITAYRSGTFYQIRDIYKLRSRITKSHHYFTVDAEMKLLELLTLSPSTHSQRWTGITMLRL